ncbi:MULTISPECIES: cytochrome c biogenesis protein ResB [Geobacter]|uniref:Cytochrome C biogenesis protein ResB n=2 Tax=Geobacter TaxID=28231 RepID=A0A0C1QZH3_9BACT|nr:MULTISPECIES: cytochrome c biogenesis protein ResB [Geobacter]ANA41416.1 cytochrome C biogenesis protein ResB [Geobacter anodireducens]KIE43601.1 cytochrome C biogenesis protein ResB [Geobacter soli]MBE2889681.1 cytochrome c biogenesis protein ResB [Geobacter anodireducens]HMN03383.1 cytochrome c biogenesis protein ResB [Geobacter anodireducens]
MLTRTYQSLASLSLGLWLMGGVMVLLAVGSFGGEEAAALNAMPLSVWLTRAPLAASWWLWGTLALLTLLTINTILCSIEAIRLRLGKSTLPALVAPQLMHLGFLLIVLAHLLSATGGAKEAMQVYQGSSIGFPDGSTLHVGPISVATGPMGMPTDYRAQVRAVTGSRVEEGTVSPNHPFFHGGFGVYLKHAEEYPFPVAVMEIHREPGAGWALAGALLFTAGNGMLLALRRERR